MLFLTFDVVRIQGRWLAPTFLELCHWIPRNKPRKGETRKQQTKSSMYCDWNDECQLEGTSCANSGTRHPPQWLTLGFLPWLVWSPSLSDPSAAGILSRRTSANEVPHMWPTCVFCSLCVWELQLWRLTPCCRWLVCCTTCRQMQLLRLRRSKIIQNGVTSKRRMTATSQRWWR